MTAFFIITLLSPYSHSILEVKLWRRLQRTDFEPRETVINAVLSYAGGADPNAVSFNGMFPLYVAAEKGALGTVQNLVRYGADVNKKTPKGLTALMNAADERMLDVVKFLVENGADPTIKNNAGYDAAVYSTMKGHHVITRYLLDRTNTPRN